jgi:hypothetical protein
MGEVFVKSLDGSRLEGILVGGGYVCVCVCVCVYVCMCVFCGECVL